MSANELALKFSNATAEDLIGKLSVLEVKEHIRDEVEDDVSAQLWQEHEFEIEAIEMVAHGLAKAIKDALPLSHKEAKKVLQKALDDWAGWG
ncbi:hypothetical protein TUM12370_24790 [Salmonella enterica subsp. enterica serovar Choleraesuis]|nr:hypothetical protein TUM12370_24790 [Salmonella enterica subsp. enterica serovar Choleraesuis]